MRRSKSRLLKAELHTISVIVAHGGHLGAFSIDRRDLRAGGVAGAGGDGNTTVINAARALTQRMDRSGLGQLSNGVFKARMHRRHQPGRGGECSIRWTPARAKRAIRLGFTLGLVVASAPSMDRRNGTDRKRGIAPSRHVFRHYCQVHRQRACPEHSCR